MPIDITKTGQAIAAHRQRMNLTQQGLADLTNVTHQAVSKWEKGLALPDTETLLVLAKLFDTTMEALLTGEMSAQPAAEMEKPAPKADAAQTAPRFSAITSMLPFISIAAADRLFDTFAANKPMDAHQLSAFAPFVSSQKLSDYVVSPQFAESSPEALASLAPFLSTQAVDTLLLSMPKPVPMHVMHMLTPFASTQALDKLVEEMAQNAGSDEAAFESFSFSGGFSAAMNQMANTLSKQMKEVFTPEKKRPADRESPRTRIILHALEAEDYKLLSVLFDEMDASQRHLLFDRAAEANNTALIRLFCENAGALDRDEVSALIELLLARCMYNELAEAAEELDEDMQHMLLDRASSISDPELLHILDEHIGQ